MSKIIITLAMAFSLQGFAKTNVIPQNVFVNIAKQTIHSTYNLGWSVGDKANYKLSIMMLEGTNNMKVASETDRGYWLNQDVNIMGQQQKVEALIDKNTGQILELKVNGKQQDVPEPPDMEVIDAKEAKVTVPAGTFNVAYVKVRNNDDNSIIELWVNLEEIPIQGAAKMIQESQMGPVTMELKSFEWAN